LRRAGVIFFLQHAHPNTQLQTLITSLMIGTHNITTYKFYYKLPGEQFRFVLVESRNLFYYQ